LEQQERKRKLDEAARKLPAPRPKPDGKPADLTYWDSDLTGFGLRIWSSGARSWFVRYRDHAARNASGKRRQPRMTIGDAKVLKASEARERARQLLAHVDLGGDPQGDRKAAQARAAVTLRTMVEPYLADRAAGLTRRALTPRSCVQARRHLLVGWAPLLDRPLHEITTADIATRMRELVRTRNLTKLKPNGQEANKALSTLSALFAWAKSQGEVTGNPVRDVAKFVKPDPQPMPWGAEYESALVEIWNACLDDDVGRIAKLLILLGARRSMIANMAKSELDRTTGIWTVHQREGVKRRLVPGKPLDIPLPRQAWASSTARLLTKANTYSESAAVTA
jgi:hypothetical protein